MKKIGILNFQYSNHNYGAVLQAAALEKIISNMVDCDVEHINFIPLPSKPSRKQIIRSKLVKFIRFFDFQRRLVKRPDAVNPHVFEEFRNKTLVRSKRKYETYKELEKYCNDYDVIIVGSDQVWRPAYTVENIMVYFLAFCKNNCRRVSYAASFGIDYWEKSEDCDFTNKVKVELKKFDFISVREDSGVKICHDVFNAHADHVLDPTLLLGRDLFDEMLPIEYADKYSYKGVVYYKLDIDKRFLDQIKNIEHRTGLKSENIYHYEKDNDYYYNTVFEWVDKIRNAHIVVTDSFHCVCISILYNKSFVYYPNDFRGMTRINSLFKNLGLEGRICNNSEDVFNVLDKNIDYDLVNRKLERLRFGSFDFLKKSLKVYPKSSSKNKMFFTTVSTETQ